MTGALEGVLVADFSRVLAGPYATMMLGDMGATVIKVERPDVGDDTRSWGPPYDESGTATYFASVNRNKTSVAWDLTSDAGRAEARALIARADIVIENFRDGTMERLGLDYPWARTVNPGVVFCSITGFGRRDGAGLPGYDLLVQAVGGLMSITGPESGEPTKVGVAMVDVLTGTTALAGVLAALRHRDRTGIGQRVEVNLLSTLLAALTNQASAYLASGLTPYPMGNRHPSVAPYEIFDTADRPIALAVGNDKQFRALALSIDHREWCEDPRFASNAERVAHRDTLYELISRELRAAGADEWFDRFTAAGIPAGPINNLAEAFDFARRLGLDPTVRIPHCAAPVVRNPITFSATPVTYRSGPPSLPRE